MSNLLIALDAVTALIEIQARYATVINAARAEGRDITAEELDVLHAANVEKRAAWDKAIGK